MGGAPRPRRVLLVGFMAAGKTAVGRALSDRLGWSLVDVDAAIVQRQGRTIARIFGEDGEPAFRRLEAAAVREALALDRVVVAPGGGWVAGPGGFADVPADALTVWLRISADAAVRRAAAEAGGEPGGLRPLLRGAEPLARARALLEEREPLYRRAALHLDAEGAAPRELAEAIARRVEAGSTSERHHRRPGATPGEG